MPKLCGSAGIYLPAQLLNSSAFEELTMGSFTVFLVLCGRRRIDQKRGKKSRKWSMANGVLNNGDITLSYKEAAQMGFTTARFVRAIDLLNDLGFIDIHPPTTPDPKTPFDRRTRYTLSDRWHLWGTPEFEQKHRPKARGGMGRRFGRSGQGPGKQETGS